MKSSFWQLGFRPFFFFGSLHAAIAIAVWISYLSTGIPRLATLDPVLWHSHEMIYGFISAIVVGFVLTASQNWTGIRGVHGWPLACLVILWIAARILLVLPFAPPLLSAIVDLSFYPLSAYFLIPYLKDPELKAERLFYLFFGLLFCGNLLIYLQTLGVWPGAGHSGVMLGLYTVILVIVFMGGRVIPFFTESSVARRQPQVRRWVEYAAHGSAALFLVAGLLLPGTLWLAVVSFGAAGVHLIRLQGWYVRRIRRIPLVWVLHLAYLWLVLGFFLTGLSALGRMPPNLAIHAFTVGCLGLIIYGMITRVSLGHTGRRLHPSASIVIGYVLLGLSALIRVFGAWLLPEHYMATLEMSGLLWIAAFAIFLWVYSPMLFSARIDGKPG